MIRDFIDDWPTGPVLLVFGLGLIGLIIVIAVSAPVVVVAVFGTALALSGLALLVKGVLAIVDESAARIELEARVDWGDTLTNTDIRGFEWTQAQVAALNQIGISARALERNPFTSDQSLLWIEIEEGPIRWITVVDPNFFEMSEGIEIGAECYIPDPRNLAKCPDISLVPTFTRNNEVVWRQRPTLDVAGEELPLPESTKTFNSLVGDNLAGDSEVVQTVLSNRPYDLYVQTAGNIGCWRIYQMDYESMWTASKWECYQAVARRLLAVSLPTDA